MEDNQAHENRILNYLEILIKIKISFYNYLFLENSNDEEITEMKLNLALLLPLIISILLEFALILFYFIVKNHQEFEFTK